MRGSAIRPTLIPHVTSRFIFPFAICTGLLGEHTSTKLSSRSVMLFWRPHLMMLSPSGERLAIGFGDRERFHLGKVEVFNLSSKECLLSFRQESLGAFLWLDNNHLFSRGRTDIQSWTETNDGNWNGRTTRGFVYGCVPFNEEVLVASVEVDPDHDFPTFHVESLNLRDGTLIPKFQIDTGILQEQEPEGFPEFAFSDPTIFVVEDRWLVLHAELTNAIQWGLFVVDIMTHELVQLCKIRDYRVEQSKDCPRTFFVAEFDYDSPEFVTTLKLGEDGRFSRQNPFPIHETNVSQVGFFLAASKSHILWQAQNFTEIHIYNAQTKVLERVLGPIENIRCRAVLEQRNELLVAQRDEPTIMAYCLDGVRLF